MRRILRFKKHYVQVLPMRFHFILHEHHRILSTDATVSALDQKKVKYDKRVYCSRKTKKIYS